MPRPYTDITLAKSNKSIKNGSAVVGVGFTAQYETLDTNVSVNPTILTIQNKYGNRFYNGSMVYVWGGIDGGQGSPGGSTNITPVTTNAPTNTPTSSVTPTSTPVATLTATPTSTSTPVATSTPTATSTQTPTPSSSVQAPSATATPTSSLPGTTATPTVSVSSSSSSGTNPEALAWANRVTSNGGTVSNSTLNAVSTFCNAIQSYGLRDKFYRLNLICGNNLAASLVPLYLSTSFGGNTIGSATDTNFNLVSGDYTETGVSGGLSGSGFGSGIDTTISSSLFDDILNFHFACYVFGNPYTQYGGAIMGNDGVFNGVRSRLGFSIPASNTNDRLRSYGIKDTTGANYTTNGLICSVVDSGSITMYGGSTGALTGNFSATEPNATSSTLNTYLLGLRLAGSVGPTYSIGKPAGSSFYSMGRKLSSTQYNQLYTALTAFQTTLGRNL